MASLTERERGDEGVRARHHAVHEGVAGLRLERDSVARGADVARDVGVQVDI